MKHELPPPHKKPQNFTSHSVLISGYVSASGISPLVCVASSTLIPTSSVPSASHITHVSLHEPVSPSTESMQFCNTTTQIMVALSHHMKQDTSIISILHCIKLIIPQVSRFLTKVFYREGLLAPRPTPKLEDHPLLAVRDCLFNLFTATLLIGGLSSSRNLRMRHVVVTGTH